MDLCVKQCVLADQQLVHRLQHHKHCKVHTQGHTYVLIAILCDVQNSPADQQLCQSINMRSVQSKATPHNVTPSLTTRIRHGARSVAGEQGAELWASWGSSRCL